MNLDKHQPTISENETAALHLLEQTLGYSYQAALRAATLLGVADHLIDGPKTTEELAKLVEAEKNKLHRILRLLATRNIFQEQDNGKFALTPAAQYLCVNQPNSLKSAVLMLTDETCWRPLGSVVESVKGNPAFKHLYGQAFFDYWAQKQDANHDFHVGMSSMSAVENLFLARNYNFPEGATIVDIAGGFGGLLLSVLLANPKTQGILFDREYVISRHRLGELNDDSRWDITTGNFFESCPIADIYMLKYITHDWPDEQASTILRNCRESMLPGGRILIMDTVIPQNNIPHTGKELDILCMAIYEGGYERTEQEFHQLVKTAGLKINQIINTGSYISIIEAIAA